jgi:starch synthase (maltosyl-transferring)
MSPLRQHPEPGQHLVHYRGDRLRFVLHAPHAGKGAAWLRTNLGRGYIQRSEIIALAERNIPPPALDWTDLPMTRQPDGHFALTLPLGEVGRFEAKAFFLPAHSDTPLWPNGPNTVVKVEPAETCCGNTIYCAFVRQFGLNRYRRPEANANDAIIRGLEDNGFAVLRVQVKGHRDLVTVVGTLPAANAGEWANAQGRWVQDREFGRQFVLAQVGDALVVQPAVGGCHRHHPRQDDADQETRRLSSLYG